MSISKTDNKTIIIVDESDKQDTDEQVLSTEGTETEVVENLTDLESDLDSDHFWCTSHYRDAFVNFPRCEIRDMPELKKIRGLLTSTNNRVYLHKKRLVGGILRGVSEWVEKITTSGIQDKDPEYLIDIPECLRHWDDCVDTLAKELIDVGFRVSRYGKPFERSAQLGLKLPQHIKIDHIQQSK